MEEEIKGITEETAQELAKAFEDLSKQCEEVTSKMHEMVGLAMKTSMECAINRFMYLCERYTNATFLTRWYWLRKAKKMPQVLMEMEKLYNEHENMNV